MNPALMAVLVATLLASFAWTIARRIALLRSGAPVAESRTDRLRERLSAVWVFAFAQRNMRHYPLAAAGHILIFLGFLVLLVRSLVLFGRGFVSGFDLRWVVPRGSAALGLVDGYAFVKDVCVLLVLIGTGIFAYLRVVRRERRMTLNTEGLLILCVIATMMVADLTYDGSISVLNQQLATGCTSSSHWCARAMTAIAPLDPPSPLGWHWYPDPAGSAVALLLAGLDLPALVNLAQAGFWTHILLVLVFLNLLPFTKHQHVLAAIPNIFLRDLGPGGRLRPLATSAEQLIERVDAAMQHPASMGAAVGYSHVKHLTWKDRLELLTCTECGRCSDNCPATLTGKVLSPKQLTLNLRKAVYNESTVENLVPSVVHPNEVWSCTTCRACEEHCPVGISYIDKIMAIRQNLVMMRGEDFPPELARLFGALETNGNPWNISRHDRAKWADGLGVRRFAQHPSAEVLLWVGCAASYDPRAQKVARATARLLQAARVDFAILGQDEGCTGDAARRAGNEHLFLTLAERNMRTIGQYQAQGGARRIVTLCPHCAHTLSHEYSDFGVAYDVVGHVSLLAQLVADRRLVPKHSLARQVVYHDSCYLGRYAGEYAAPRTLLDVLPGIRRLEPNRFSRQRAMCCGAGGAQMWLDDHSKSRINSTRFEQLAATGADSIASACPFCLLMLTDAAKDAEGILESKGSEMMQNPTADIAELLAHACGLADI